MGKVVLRCPACNSYYDGGLYSHCPYCKNETGNAVVVVKDTPTDFSDSKNDGNEKKSGTRKKAGFWDRFSRKSHVEEQKKTLSSYESSSEKDIADTSENGIKYESDLKETNDTQKGFYDEERQNEKQSLQNNDSDHDVTSSKLSENNNNQPEEEQAQKKTVGRFTSEIDVPAQSENEHNAKKHDDDQNSTSLMSDIRNYGVTQGRYFSNGSTSPVAPVVGWLVCVKGNEIGKSFNLKKGRNRIGRSVDMDVKLLNETSVSRTCQAVLIYDPKLREYYLLPGESDSLCYLNDRALYERTALSDRDFIEFGDSGKNRYVFAAFCNQDFDWNMNEE